MTIWEQVDVTPCCDRPGCGERLRYSWMLSRAYATRSEMLRWGWKWIAGKPRGVWVTNDPAAVDRARAALRLGDPQSNGSHQRAGQPMHDIHAARMTLRREYVAGGMDADVEIDGLLDMNADQLRDELAYLGDYQG